MSTVKTYKEMRNEIVELLSDVFNTFNEHIAPEGLMMQMYINQFKCTISDVDNSINDIDELEPNQVQSLCEYGFLSKFDLNFQHLYDVYFLDIHSKQVEDIAKDISKLAKSMGNSKINIVVVDFCFNESSELETVDDIKILDIFENYLANKKNSKKIIFYSMNCTEELLSTTYINSVVKRCKESNGVDIQELTRFENVLNDNYLKDIPKFIYIKDSNSLTVEQITALSYLTLKGFKFTFSSNVIEQNYYNIINRLFTGRYFFSKDIFVLYKKLVGTPVIVSKGNPCNSHLLYGVIQPTDVSKIVKYYPINIAVSDIHIDSMVHAIGDPETLDLDSTDITFLDVSTFNVIAKKYKKIKKNAGVDLDLVTSLQEVLNRFQRIAVLKNMSPLKAVSFKEIAIFLKDDEFYFTVIPDYLNKVKVEVLVDDESLVREVPIENIYPTQCVHTLNAPIDYESSINLPDLRASDLTCIAWGMNPETNSKNKAFDKVNDASAILYMIGIEHSSIDTEFLKDMERINRTMIQNLSIGDDGRVSKSLPLMHTL